MTVDDQLRLIEPGAPLLSPDGKWVLYTTRRASLAALRKFGAPARLIRYPGEPHDFQQPLHLRLRDTQDIAWMPWYVRGIRVPEAHLTAEAIA